MISLYTISVEDTVKKDNSDRFLAFVVLGLLVRITPALDPIHEMMHWIAVELDGGVVTSIEWSKIYWRGASSRFPLVAAYWFELFLYFFAHLWRRKGFAFGALLVVWVTGVISVDFERYGSDENIVIFAIVGLILIIAGLYEPRRVSIRA